MLSRRGRSSPPSCRSSPRTSRPCASVCPTGSCSHLLRTSPRYPWPIQVDNELVAIAAPIIGNELTVACLKSDKTVSVVHTTDVRFTTAEFCGGKRPSPNRSRCPRSQYTQSNHEFASVHVASHPYSRTTAIRRPGRGYLKNTYDEWYFVMRSPLVLPEDPVESSASDRRVTRSSRCPRRDGPELLGSTYSARINRLRRPSGSL